MKIPYKATSGAALGALALLFVPSAWMPVPSPPRSEGWDVVCGLIDDQWDTTPKLLVAVWLGAYVVFVRQGLRNRSGPRWLAIAGLLALFLWIESQSLWISGACGSPARATHVFLWAGIVSVMFLHHGFQRPAKFVDRPPSGSSRGPGPADSLRRALRAVLPALAFLPIASFELRLLGRLGNDPTQTAIGVVQNCISWVTFALFLIVIALLLGLLIVRLRNTIRT